MRQLAFIDAYIKSSNATQAYKEVYDCSNTTDKSVNENASRLLKNPKVVSRLAEIEAEAVAASRLSRQWIIENLMKVVEQAMHGKDLKAANRALELLGKVDVMALFVERSSVQTENNTTITHADVQPFAELLEQAEEQQRLN